MTRLIQIVLSFCAAALLLLNACGGYSSTGGNATPTPTPTPTPIQFGPVQCRDNADCPNNSLCFASLPGGMCVTCTNDAGCPTGTTCGANAAVPAASACLRSCTSNANCSLGARSLGRLRPRPRGQACPRARTRRTKAAEIRTSARASGARRGASRRRPAVSPGSASSPSALDATSRGAPPLRKRRRAAPLRRPAAGARRVGSVRGLDDPAGGTRAAGAVGVGGIGTVRVGQRGTITELPAASNRLRLPGERAMRLVVVMSEPLPSEPTRRLTRSPEWYGWFSVTGTLWPCGPRSRWLPAAEQGVQLATAWTCTACEPGVRF